MRVAALLLAIPLASGPAWAQPKPYETTISGHRFQPAELHVPADAAFAIMVKNDDPSAEEFESAAMGVEKVIPGGRSLLVRIRPLAPGRYEFMGEYNADTAKGVVVVGEGH